MPVTARKVAQFILDVLGRSDEFDGGLPPIVDGDLAFSRDVIDLTFGDGSSFRVEVKKT